MSSIVENNFGDPNLTLTEEYQTLVQYCLNVGM